METIKVSQEVMDKVNAQMEESKWYKVSRLKEGTKIQLTNGETAIFNRLKQKYFIGIQNGQAFNFPVEWFEKVLEEPKANTSYKTLKKGEPFYISNGKDAILFTFDSMGGGTYIYGISPVTMARTKIAVSLYIGKVSEIAEKMAAAK